jgi:hypothetical protein
MRGVTLGENGGFQTAGRFPGLGSLLLSATHAVQRGADHGHAAFRCLHPGPDLPRWLVPHMQSMATFELGHPVPHRVLMKADYPLSHAVPSMSKGAPDGEQCPQAVLARLVSQSTTRRAWMCRYSDFSNQWWAYGSRLNALTSRYPLRL